MDYMTQLKALTFYVKDTELQTCDSDFVSFLYIDKWHRRKTAKRVFKKHSFVTLTLSESLLYEQSNVFLWIYLKSS